MTTTARLIVCFLLLAGFHLMGFRTGTIYARRGRRVEVVDYCGLFRPSWADGEMRRWPVIRITTD